MRYKYFKNLQGFDCRIIFNYPAFSGFKGTTIPNATVPKTNWAVGSGGQTTMCFSQQVENPVLLLSSLGDTFTHTSVKITLYIDSQKITEGVDGNVRGPIYKTGAAGVRGDNTEFYFKNFSIDKL